MFKLNDIHMQFVNITKTDTYYELTGVNGEKVLMPATDIILVDDESGAITVKNTASRCSIGYMVK